MKQATGVVVYIMIEYNSLCQLTTMVISLLKFKVKFETVLTLGFGLLYVYKNTMSWPLGLDDYLCKYQLVAKFKDWIWKRKTLRKKLNEQWKLNCYAISDFALDKDIHKWNLPYDLKPKMKLQAWY